MPEQPAQQETFDLVVVGGGPGGYPAAIRAAQLGLRTALVEKERPGGVCLNWGCIPTKAMLRSAEVLETMRHGAELGVLADNVRLDYPAVLARKERVVKTLTDGVASLLKANGVTVVNGHARFVGPTTVEVGRVEPGQPVPQREVGRRGLLGLQGDDAPDGLDHVQRFAVQEQLAAERGPVEPPAGEGHASILTTWVSTACFFELDGTPPGP